MSRLTIRRCDGNREAWCLDTGTDLAPITAMSLDSLVSILAGYEAGTWPREITLVVDRGAEHEAALCRLRREAEELTREAKRITERRHHLNAQAARLGVAP